MTAARNLAPLMSSERDTWNTPREVLDIVRRVGPIGLDPCSNLTSVVGARVAFDLEEGLDGLALPWADVVRTGEVVFVNPPYGREIGQWTRRCREQGEAGAQVVALVPARVDTRWWHADCAPPKSRAVCFMAGRVRFVGGASCAPFPTALVYWGSRPGLFEDACRDVGAIWGAR